MQLNASPHPIWGKHCQSCIPISNKVREELFEKLKVETKGKPKKASNDLYKRQLQMVDVIQRLGISYHFEEEIDQFLQNLFKKFDDYCKDSNDMYTISLSFRLLRQHGYKVSCKLFKKFKEVQGKVRENYDEEEVMRMLEFYEATHLRVHDEDVLDRGFDFSRRYLESALPRLKPESVIAKQVHHALKHYSNRRGIPRLEAWHYIAVYEQHASRDEDLLRLAKLDFNLLQSLHKKELADLDRWRQDLQVPTKLTEDRLEKIYFWGLGVYFEPKYSLARKFLAKIQAILSSVEDDYNANATFRDAIERWDMSCLNRLPDYMKIYYRALLETFEGINEEMMKQGKSCHTSYGIEAVKELVRHYFAEAERNKPTTKKNLQFASMSIVCPHLIIISFIGMGDKETKEACDWVLSKPDMVKALSIICKRTDNIAGRESERKRDAKEHKVPKQDAVYELNKEIEGAWKDMNKGFFKTTIPTAFLYCILNFARVIEVMYRTGEDWSASVGPEMQSFIKQFRSHSISK